MDDSNLNARKRDFGNSGRCSKARTKKRYARKRKYPKKNEKSNDNKPPAADMSAPAAADATNQTSDETIAPKQTASSSKIIDIVVPVTPEKVPATTKKFCHPPSRQVSGYRFMDMSILAKVFLSVCCPGCGTSKSLELHDIDGEKKGLARSLQLKCSACLYTDSFSTSKRVQIPNDGKGGQKVYDVNARAVYAFRQIGGGYEHLKKLCCYMNMPTPMLKNNYQKLTNKLLVSAKNVAEKSMSDAASKLRGSASTAEVGVSVDGTWQRKGFTSMNGIITAISVDNGKVLDTCILSKNCKGCTKMSHIKRTDADAYEK